MLANVGAWVSTFLYQLYNYIFALSQRVKYHLQSFPRVLPAKGQRYLNLILYQYQNAIYGLII